MTKFGIILTLLLAWATPASPHDQWTNGEPVPGWIKAACCGPADAHHLTPDQVHEVEGGFKIDGFPDVIPYDKVLPSQDGDAWAFYKTYPDGTVGTLYCFFYSTSI